MDFTVAYQYIKFDGKSDSVSGNVHISNSVNADVQIYKQIKDKINNNGSEKRGTGPQYTQQKAY